MRIREQHAKEKAQLIHSSSNAGEAERKAEGSHSPSQNKASSVFEANKKILDQMEQLRLELRKNQDAFAEERKLLQVDFNNKLTQQDRKYKSEILELKSTNALLEDKLSHGKDDVSTLKAEIQSLKSLNHHLENVKNQTLEEQNKLRADLKNMQSSLAASFRLDTTANPITSSPSKQTMNNPLQRGGLPNDMEAALKLHDAKYEAKLRQMNNKVEFLKSQLESERKSCDEAKVALQDSQNIVAQIREEYDSKLRVVERDHLRRLAETEERVGETYEKRMTELTTLQRTLLAMQAQSQEMSQENLMYKQREDLVQAQLNKAQVTQLALRTEIEDLRAQVQSLQMSKEQDLKKDSNKLTQEAVLRRLDNERNYLKNQLTSEITLKNELQTVLTQCQEQLSQAQKQWQEDVNTLKDKQTQLKREFAEKEQRYQSTQGQLEHDLAHSKKTGHDLKDGFIKLRDQLRIEQLNIENLNGEKQRMKDQIRSLEDDIKRREDYEQQSRLQHDLQVQNLQLVMQEQESTHKEEQKRMKDELARQFITNSELQIDLLKTKDLVEKEQLRIQRKIQVVRIFEILKRWRKSRVYQAFKSWSTSSTLIGVAKQFKSQVEKLIKQTVDEQQQEKQKALAKLSEELAKQQAEAVEKCRQECEQHWLEERQVLAEEHQAEMDNLRADHSKQIQQMEADFEYDMQQNQRMQEEKIQRLLSDFDYKTQSLQSFHQNQIRGLNQEWEKKAADMVQTRTEELEALHADVMRQKDEEHYQLLEKCKRQFEVDLDFKLYTQKSQFEEEKMALLAQAEAEREALRARLAEEHAQHCAELTRQHNEALDTLRKKYKEEEDEALRQQRVLLHEEHEEHLRALRQAWQDEYDENLAKDRTAMEEEFEKKRADIIREKDAEKLKAIKMEANKWRQVLQDTEGRMELEVAKLKIEEKQNLEKSWEDDKQRLRASFELQRARDTELFNIEKSEMRKAFEAEKSTLINEQQKYWQDEMFRFELRRNEELKSQFESKMLEEIKKKEVAFNQQLAVEKDRHDALKKDYVTKNTLYAQERSNLMRQIEDYDNKIEALESLKIVELEQQRKDFEAEKDLLGLQQEEEKRQLRVDFDKEKAQLQADLERNFEDQMDRNLTEERQRLQEYMESQLQQLQEESEKLVNQLESALNDLKNEKLSLSAKIDEMASKLEDTEDALYDSRQAFKSLQKEHSLFSWQVSTKIIVMKQRFQKGMEDFDREANQRFEFLRQDMQTKWNDLALHYFKIVNFVNQIEEKRNILVQIIAHYKPEDLKRMKKKIQVLEQEIERMTLERDAIEDQRETMLKEIDDYTLEVREHEELVRQHQQDSSMTVNGRINVAHARKKRRLDQEIERLLEQIEHKRSQIQDIDQNMLEKTRAREIKEEELMEVERELVGILIEQQRMSLKEVQDMSGFVEKTKMLTTMQRFPWPVPGPEVFIKDVQDLVEKWKQEDARK